MKRFQEQFVKCKDEGYNENTIFLSFKDHPDLLPLCPEKRKTMLESGAEGVNLYICSKYGGICSSSNQGCIEERTKL